MVYDDDDLTGKEFLGECNVPFSTCNSKPFELYDIEKTDKSCG